MMVSVIICTRDRARSLRRTLESLAAMDVPDWVAWEILAVDNGSTDETPAVVRDQARTSPVPLRYVREPALGLSCARNTGIRAARGEILAFTDDDVVVDRNWLAEIHREFTLDPSLGLLTGRTLMPEAAQPELAAKSQTTRQRFRHPCNPRRQGNGNNMSLRASILAEVGAFDERLGPGRYALGEDIDHMYRIMKAGHRAVFSPGPLVYHHHDRRTTARERERRLLYVRGWGTVLCKHTLRGDRWMGRLLLAEAWRLLRATLRPGNPDRLWALRRWLALCAGAIHWIPLAIREKIREPHAAAE